MRILLQRTTSASVQVEGECIASIGQGVLALVGVDQGDNPEIADAMAAKIVNLRIFPDLLEKSHFDRSLLDIGGDVLAVSQFTLCGETRKGRRPDFSGAAAPTDAQRIMNSFLQSLCKYQIHVQTGRFGAMMAVSLVNDGPVSIWIDSRTALPANANAKARKPFEKMEKP